MYICPHFHTKQLTISKTLIIMAKELKGSKTEQNLGSFRRRIAGKKQVHLLRFESQEGRLRADGTTLPGNS